MTNPGWLPLNEYSAKYKISLSTLRRRIHSDEADYRFENGKYWIADRPMPKHSRVDMEFQGQQPPLSSRDQMIPNPAMPNASFNESPTPAFHAEAQNEGVLDSANRFLEEIKRAYISVLQEKESQIMQLREEVVDLKTLVKILESDNERLRGEKLNDNNL